MHTRRLLVLALGATLAGNPALRRAQTPAAGPRRVGVLTPSTRAKEEVTLRPFFDEMRALGWFEGQNMVYDRVYADDQPQDLPRLAAELVARNPQCSARIVDKILKGAQPTDIPVQQPTRFAFTVNLKAARVLGITIPRGVLLRADEVIE